MAATAQFFGWSLGQYGEAVPQQTRSLEEQQSFFLNRKPHPERETPIPDQPPARYSEGHEEWE